MYWHPQSQASICEFWTLVRNIWNWPFNSNGLLTCGSQDFLPATASTIVQRDELAHTQLNRGSTIQRAVKCSIYAAVPVLRVSIYRCPRPRGLEMPNNFRNFFHCSLSRSNQSTEGWGTWDVKLNIDSVQAPHNLQIYWGGWVSCHLSRRLLVLGVRWGCVHSCWICTASQRHGHQPIDAVMVWSYGLLKIYRFAGVCVFLIASSFFCFYSCSGKIGLPMLTADRQIKHAW